MTIDIDQNIPELDGLRCDATGTRTMIDLTLAKSWHKFFTDKVEALANAGDGGLDSATAGRVCDDSACKLGKWLYGEGNSMLWLPTFKHLKAAHEHYHDHACQYLMAHLSNDKSRFETAQFDFRYSSQQVLDAVDQLQAVVKEARRNRNDSFPSVVIGPETEVPWDESLTIGIPMIDEQHRMILILFNRFTHHMTESLHSEAAIDYLTEMGKIFALHFEAEEAVLKKLGMAAEALEKHTRKHTEILQEYADLNLQVMESEGAKVKDILDTVKAWVVDHVVDYDLDIRKYAQ
jgi:hemerythrin-like metal-binding protein